MFYLLLELIVNFRRRAKLRTSEKFIRLPSGLIHTGPFSKLLFGRDAKSKIVSNWSESASVELCRGGGWETTRTGLSLARRAPRLPSLKLPFSPTSSFSFSSTHLTSLSLSPLLPLCAGATDVLPSGDGFDFVCRRRCGSQMYNGQHQRQVILIIFGNFAEWCDVALFSVIDVWWNV